MGPKITYVKDGTTDFDVYSPKDDHIIYIKKAGYSDIDLYYVIVEDAYRTPSADVMSPEDIERIYGIKLKD